MNPREAHPEALLLRALEHPPLSPAQRSVVVDFLSGVRGRELLLSAFDVEAYDRPSSVGDLACRLVAAWCHPESPTAEIVRRNRYYNLEALLAESEYEASNESPGTSDP